MVPFSACNYSDKKGNSTLERLVESFSIFFCSVNESINITDQSLSLSFKQYINLFRVSIGHFIGCRENGYLRFSLIHYTRF